MPTTTNYGWTTPADTDLVKDGASAIRTLGTSIDTTTKNLNPSTTLGDIEYRSSTANTNTRLGIGTTGQVLTVSGGVPAWATPSSGGLTLLSTTTLSTNSVTISSISGSYKNLVIIGRNISQSVSDNTLFRLNSITSSSYAWTRNRATGTSQASYSTDGDTSVEIFEVGTSNAWNYQGYFQLILPRYTETENHFYFLQSGSRRTNSRISDLVNGSIDTTAAISSFTIFGASGTTTFSTGTVYVYGES